MFTWRHIPGRYACFALVCAAIVLAGCPGPKPQPTPPPVTNLPSLPTDLRPPVEPSGKMVIAVVPKAISGEYWLDCQKGADEKAKELGVELQFNGPPAETAVEQQISLMETLIANKVTGIGISPCDGKALVPVIEKAVASGIPVVTVDSDAETDKKLSYIGTDNKAAGRIAGEQLAKLLDGKGEVAIITGVPGAQNLLARIEGFKEVISKFPGIKVVDEQPCQSDKALAITVTENMLTAHRDLKGLFTVNAPGAPGAAEGLRSTKKVGQVKVVGFDAIPDSLRYCKEGIVDVLIAQRPRKMGELSVQYLVDASRKKEIPKLVDTGVDIITKDKVDAYMQEHPSGG